MARQRLDLVRHDFADSIIQANTLYSLFNMTYRDGSIQQRCRLSGSQFYELVGFAFLHAFLAWEQLLEESFILYMLGKSAPNGYQAPRRITQRMTHNHAISLVRGTGRYPKWEDMGAVLRVSGNFFDRGRPYESILRPNATLLDDMRTTRNACAHSSINSKKKLGSLIRRRLGQSPTGFNAGRYLTSFIPNTTTTFFDYYVNTIQTMGDRLIPA